MTVPRAWIRALGFLSLGLLAAPVFAQKAKRITPEFKAQSRAYIESTKEGWVFVTENTRLEFATLRPLESERWTNLLLKATYRNETFPHGEGLKGRSVVEAWTLDPGHPKALRWTLRGYAHEGAIWDRMLKLTTYGCCETPTVHRYYSLLTGNLVLASHADLLGISVGRDQGPVEDRYLAFGYEDPWDEKAPPCLQFSSAEAALVSVEVLSRRECHILDLPKLRIFEEGVEKEHLNLFGEPITFIALLRYPDGVEVRLPFVKGEPQLDQATLPPGFSLRRRPTPQPASKP